jgi:hypothetical protein
MEAIYSSETSFVFQQNYHYRTFVSEGILKDAFRA